MRHRAAWWLALGVGLNAVHAAALDAETEGIHVSLRGPSECPSAATVRDEVQRLARLGPDARHHLEAELMIEAIGANRLRLVLTTSLDGISGERTLIGQSCSEIAAAAALTLALMLNPEASPPESAAPPPSQAAPVSRSTSVEGNRSATSWPPLHAFVGVSGGARVGVLPSIAPEVGGTLGLSLGVLSTWLGVTYAPPQTAVVWESSFGGRFGALNGTWLACWEALDTTRVGVGPCAGIGLSRLSGHGVGVSEPKDAQATWVSGTLGLTASVTVSRRISFRGLALGALPATRPSFFLQEIGPVHRPAAVSATLAGVLAVRVF